MVPRRRLVAASFQLARGPIENRPPRNRTLPQPTTADRSSSARFQSMPRSPGWWTASARRSGPAITAAAPTKPTPRGSGGSSSSTKSDTRETWGRRRSAPTAFDHGIQGGNHLKKERGLGSLAGRSSGLASATLSRRTGHTRKSFGQHQPLILLSLCTASVDETLLSACKDALRPDKRALRYRRRSLRDDKTLMRYRLGDLRHRREAK